MLAEKQSTLTMFIHLRQRRQFFQRVLISGIIIPWNRQTLGLDHLRIPIPHLGRSGTLLTSVHGDLYPGQNVRPGVRSLWTLTGNLFHELFVACILREFVVCGKGVGLGEHETRGAVDYGGMGSDHQVCVIARSKSEGRRRM